MRLKLSYRGVIVFGALSLMPVSAFADPAPVSAPTPVAVSAATVTAAPAAVAPQAQGIHATVTAMASEPAQEQKVSAPVAAAAEKDTIRTPETTSQATLSGDEPKQEVQAAAEPEDKGGRFAMLVPPLSIALNPDDYKANRALERSFTLYTVNIRKNFTRWLERSSRYMEVMKEVLKDRNMPQELVYLPFVESGFNTQAYSSARAAGPWQFISGTAKRYGLTIDWWRDERKDPIKSTEAAAAYLKDLYGMFGSWDLALAAYNAGEGRIAKALRRSDAEDIWDLLGTRHIRQETQDYVPRFIAASVIASKPQEYGFTDIDFHAPFEYDEVTLEGPVDLDVIAECADTSVQEIKELNPELRRWSTPPNMKSYTIRIPKGTRDDFLENLAEYQPEERFTCDYYKVRKKDNIKTVAKRAGVPVGIILALNRLTGIERLAPGESLMIPPKGKYVADIDDKMSARKVALKKKKGKGGKATAKTAKGSSKSPKKGKQIKGKKAVEASAKQKQKINKA